MSDRRRYTFDYNGRRYTIEGPDGMSEDDLAAAVGGSEPKSEQGWLTRNIAEPFNRGLAQMADFPVDLANMAIRGAYGIGKSVSPRPEMWENPPQLPSGGMQQAFQSAGLTLPPEQQEHGFVPRTMEIAGGSVLPTGLMGGMGRQAIRAGAPSVPYLAERGLAAPPPAQGLDRLTRGIAESPKMTAAGELAASATSAGAGEVARGLTDDPTTIALAELAGGFVLPVGVTVATSGPAGMVARQIKKHVTPMTEAGARPRAEERVQGLAADPAASAERIGQYPNLSPARQTGDPRLLGLEQRYLQDNPAADLAYTENLKARRTQLGEEAKDFGGDTERVRATAAASRKRVIDKANQRAALAAQDAERRIAELDTGADPRQSSTIVRETLENSLTEARAAEREIWRTLDMNAPARVDNTQAAIDGIIAERSRLVGLDDLNSVPELRRLMGELQVDAKLREQLVQAGLLRPDQQDIPVELLAQLRAQGVIETPTYTLKDLEALRSSLLRQARDAGSGLAPDRQKARLLSHIANGDPDAGMPGLIDDMKATGVDGVEEAFAFSRQLNDRFTRGEVGKILRYEAAGGQGVSPETTMQRVVMGENPGRGIDQMMQASPEAGAQIQNWLKSTYLEAVVPGGKFDPGAHQRFMKDMRRRGVFDRFPELEQQFNQAATATDKAAALGERAARAGTSQNGRARVTLYLDADPGTEMDRLLQVKNPATYARSLVRRLKGDRLAQQGAKTEFVDSVLRSSYRNDEELGQVITGKTFRQRLSEMNRNGTMDALGFTPAEKQRLAKIADELVLIDRKPGQMPPALVEDGPSAIASIVARVAGARVGGQMGGNMGGSIQAANIWSRKMEQALQLITKDRAAQLIADAQSDPELYRSLLVNASSPIQVQEQAAAKIQNWMLGAAATQDERTQ